MKTVQEPQLNFNPYNVFRGFITNQFNDLLPVGLLAQLVRALHRNRKRRGLAESNTSFNFFSGFLFATAKVVQSDKNDVYEGRKSVSKKSVLQGQLSRPIGTLPGLIGSMKKTFKLLSTSSMHKMKETISSPNSPGEVRLNKVILVMKGQKTETCSVAISSSVSRNDRTLQ